MSLLARLDVERGSENEFRGSLEGFDGRIFGGEILAKAVSAALLTAAGRELHSVHAYFLRAVPPEQPLRFAVRVLRDGRRLASRRVAVVHDERKVAEVTVSLAAKLDGPHFEDRPHELDVPAPDESPTLADLAREEGWEPRDNPLDWRYVEHPWRQSRTGEGSHWRAWIRPREPLPDDPRVHAAALAYLSDYGSLGALQRRFGEAFEWSASASLDHALWIHRPLRWRDWILMESHSELGFGGRALTERRIFGADGRRIATVAQEALFAVKNAR